LDDGQMELLAIQNRETSGNDSLRSRSRMRKSVVDQNHCCSQDKFRLFLKRPGISANSSRCGFRAVLDSARTGK
jgi:hypothetical protein